MYKKTIKIINDMIMDKKYPNLRIKYDNKLTPPFWMIIHAMQLNVALNTINNLNKKDSLNIKSMLYFNLTKVGKWNYRYRDRKGKRKISFKKRNEDASKFFGILEDIGKFRNLLAHNNPIYNYNVRRYTFEKKFEVEFLIPCKNLHDISNKVKILKDGTGVTYYGDDAKIQKNLAYIIYSISSIVSAFDSDTKCNDEIYECFLNHGMVDNSLSKSTIFNELNKLKDLLKNTPQTIEEFNDINSRDLILFNDSVHRCSKELKLHKTNQNKYSYLDRFFTTSGLSQEYLNKMIKK